MPLILRAYARLLLLDFYVALGGFPRLYRCIQTKQVTAGTVPPAIIEKVCSAVDHASIWYWKRVLCLQRSAAATSLLREHGVAAELVIGVQQVPFKAHAWVEVAGRTVNDKTYVSEIYSAVDRISAGAGGLP